MKTVKSVQAEMREKFRAAGLDTPELDARLLLQAALCITHENLLLNDNRLISDSESKILEDMTARRLQREPVSRILGKRAFWKSEFKVSRETLDPRPDSEVLIEAAVKYLKKDAAVNILDLGTGTGCLLLSLLDEFPRAKGVGIDISQDSIATAKENASALTLSQRSLFMVNNWKDLREGQSFDVVISNPPYIAEAEIASLEPEVREYDPFQALSGGTDGLDCYRDIAALLPRLLVKGGRVFLEIGATQAKAVREILAEQGLSVLEVAPDLSGHDRCVIAQLA